MAKTRKTASSEPARCTLCGKVLPASGSKGEGHRCKKLIADGYNAEKLAEARKRLTLEKAPEGYIKLQDAWKKLQKFGVKGCTKSAFINAFGTDRGVYPPVNPVFQVVYVGSGGTRYMHSWCGTKSAAQAIANGDFSKAPKIQSPFVTVAPEPETDQSPSN